MSESEWYYAQVTKLPRTIDNLYEKYKKDKDTYSDQVTRLPRAIGNLYDKYKKEKDTYSDSDSAAWKEYFVENGVIPKDEPKLQGQAA